MKTLATTIPLGTPTAIAGSSEVAAHLVWPLVGKPAKPRPKRQTRQPRQAKRKPKE